MSKSVPGYAHHKASNRAYVYLDKKRIYLGPYGSPESHRAYTDEISKWQTRQTEQPTNVTIAELTLLYAKHSEQYYQKNGKITSEVYNIRMALRQLNQLYRATVADTLTPMMLETVRSKMQESGRYCRDTINRNVRHIVRCWKWGVSKGLVSASTWQSLTSLEALQAGRCDVREFEPVLPVSLADVEAVRPHVAAPVWGAIQFQLATAARPGEALQLRLGDIDRSGDVWIYRPDSHKTEHHGKSRIILIGPKAQAVIMEHAQTTDPDAYVFAVPGTAGQRPYRRDSYTNAIKRACEVAHNMPKELRHLKADAAEDLKAQAAEWRKEHCWHPHQLRHTSATAIRKASGIEVAKTILGHGSLTMAELYAEKDLCDAAEVVQKIG